MEKAQNSEISNILPLPKLLRLIQFTLANTISLGWSVMWEWNFYSPPGDLARGNFQNRYDLHSHMTDCSSETTQMESQYLQTYMHADNFIRINVFLQKRMCEEGPAVKEGDKMDQVITELEEEIKENIKEICKNKKHCKYENFKVLQIKLDMGIKIGNFSTSSLVKYNPFHKIYFYDKKSPNRAEQIKWEDVTIFPVPE
jgi:hypothetical protein